MYNKILKCINNSQSSIQSFSHTMSYIFFYIYYIHCMYVRIDAIVVFSQLENKCHPKVKYILTDALFCRPYFPE